MADGWGCSPREVLERVDSRELTELLAWDRIKRGVKGPQDNVAAKAAIRAALKSGLGGKKKGKGTTPTKPRKEPKA